MSDRAALAVAGRARPGWRYAVLEIACSLLDFAPRRAAPRAARGAWAWRRSACCATASTTRAARWTPPPAPSIVPPGLGRPARGVRPADRGHADRARPPTGRCATACVPALRRGELADELAGPPRRLSLAEIDDYLRRIEEL